MRGPFVSVDVLDETSGFEWLGAWQRTPLSEHRWTRVEALVRVDASRAGHSLDTSLVLGGAYPGVALDDIVVSAPPIVGAGTSVRCLAVSFDDEASVSHLGVVHTAGAAGTDTRLVLCHVTAQMPGVVKVVFWARTPEKHPAPRVSVDIFDVTSDWEWLGTPDDFRLTTSWQRIEVSHQLPQARVGHRLELGLQLARSAGIVLIDDLEVWGPRSADGIPPRVMPPPLPKESA